MMTARDDGGDSGGGRQRREIELMSDKRASIGRPVPTSQPSSFPGGVNSPVRAFKAVGGTPVFIQRGVGAYVYDVDGNRYVDFVGSWGPLIARPRRPRRDRGDRARRRRRARRSARRPRARSSSASCCSSSIPSLEKMRFVSSGTEATMWALRVARGFTERDKIIKIDGGYHGHADALLVAAGSGAATLGIPGSAGVTAGVGRRHDRRAVQRSRRHARARSRPTPARSRR